MCSVKECSQCLSVKDLSMFYKHSEMKDGHLNKCIDCVKKRVKKYRSKNIDRIRAYDRARGSRQTKEYLRNYRAKNKNKYKAHNKVKNAIRAGKLIKPSSCEHCGNSCYLVAHHCDYLKPLNVNWLCEPCHKKWHLENGEGLNGN